MKKGILKQFIAPVVRGVVKSLPFGGVVVESVKNIQTEIKNKKDAINQPIDLPHNWLSIAIQMITVAGILYALLTKQIDINKFIELLK
jgi:hypothetical protein